MFNAIPFIEVLNCCNLTGVCNVSDEGCVDGGKQSFLYQHQNIEGNVFADETFFYLVVYVNQ